MRRLFDGDEFLRDGKGHKNNLLIDAGVNRRRTVKGLIFFSGKRSVLVMKGKENLEITLGNKKQA